MEDLNGIELQIAKEKEQCEMKGLLEGRWELG